MPDYERLHRLGSGAFGEVWLVYDRALGVQRAVKYVLPSKVHDPTEFYREPQILLALRHPNVVEVQDAGKEPDGSLYIAMEYLPEGSVESKYAGGPVPVTVARRYVCGVAWGLQYAHDLGYIHRDIKPANILISQTNTAKLADFGLATKATATGAASPYGYMTHLAPEVVDNDATSIATDIYALGVTAYRLVNGDDFLPRPGTIAEFQDHVRRGEYPDRSRYRPYVPRSMRLVINKAMHPDPSRRFATATEFRTALEKIPLRCDWDRKVGRSAITYRTKVGATEIRVVVTRKASDRFDVETWKKSGTGYRRVSAGTHRDIDRKRTRVVVHKLLSRIVSTGR
jgi:eukaryotic-like serine/threonine-protein kinase